MSAEQLPGPYSLTKYHALGLEMRKAREQMRINIIKELAEDLHRAGFSVSKTGFKDMTKEVDLDDHYYNNEFSVEFVNLINPIKGLNSNCIHTAILRLPESRPEDNMDRNDMAIVEVTYKDAKPPKIDRSYRWQDTGNGRSGYSDAPGLADGGFVNAGEEIRYISISEFAEDYANRIPAWKSFNNKYKAKLKSVEAELKALKKLNKTK